MAKDQQKAWRCTVCGYVHQGDQPPECCPVCGAPASDFEPQQPPAPPAQAAPSSWQCLVCGYAHEAAEPAEACPVCAAGPDQFEPQRQTEEQSQASGDAPHVVIIGGGIAGVSAAESARGACAACRITLICGESPLPYYRLNLTRYLAGEITSSVLPVHPQQWYRDKRIDLRDNARATAISPSSHTVTFADGSTLEYDRLILAMGSHPFIPPIAGSDLEGVVSLRTVADADAILEKVASNPACVCIGGGVLGLETAGALAKRGLKVTVLESHEWLMPRQLNRRAGEILEAHLKELGIGLQKQARSRAIVGERSVSGVELQDGSTVPAQMVVIATGVRPDTYLARTAHIEVNRGIVVDNHLRTDAADIFAAGDVAEHNGILYGVWGPSQYQGSIAGLNAVGVETLFGGVPRSNTLKVLGLDMLSIGQVDAADGSYQVVEGQPDDNFHHFVFRDGKMVGCILLGDTSLSAPVKQSIEEGRDFSSLLVKGPAVSDVRTALGA